MKKIIYYVATSLDGYIAGRNHDISGFVGDGNGVEKYLNDLREYGTVIMGRITYEFGYQYGLTPGQPAYPHMDHYIFSESLSFDTKAANVHVKKPTLTEVDLIKESAKTNIYLCGGGTFAGWLLEHERIDQLILKINPLVLGDGIKIFGNSQVGCNLQLTSSKQYDRGLMINTYNIEY